MDVQKTKLMSMVNHKVVAAVKVIIVVQEVKKGFMI